MGDYSVDTTGVQVSKSKLPLKRTIVEDGKKIELNTDYGNIFDKIEQSKNATPPKIIENSDGKIVVLYKEGNAPNSLRIAEQYRPDGTYDKKQTIFKSDGSSITENGNDAYTSNSKGQLVSKDDAANRLHSVYDENGKLSSVEDFNKRMKYFYKNGELADSCKLPPSGINAQ